jgi:hypothetical protein
MYGKTSRADSTFLLLWEETEQQLAQLALLSCFCEKSQQSAEKNHRSCFC